MGEGGLVPPFTLLGYPASEALRRRCAENYRHEKVIPDPAPSSAEAMSWHIEASRRDWIGEFIPGTMPPERIPIRATG